MQKIPAETYKEEKKIKETKSPMKESNQQIRRDLSNIKNIGMSSFKDAEEVNDLVFGRNNAIQKYPRVKVPNSELLPPKNVAHAYINKANNNKAYVDLSDEESEDENEITAGFGRGMKSVIGTTQAVPKTTSKKTKSKAKISAI
mmetsp:Transcript_22711/g.22554  ORF Transcript_22711/g.22554 Transcript_22711/m.22554 type:complete len:144 (+) Transcript_22711:1274-1705(+)